MGKYIISGLTIVLITGIVNGVLSLLKSRRPEYSQGIVRLPRFLLVFGIILTAIFTIISVCVSFLSENNLFTVIIFMGLGFLSSTMIIAQINCVITFDETGYTRQTFFGIKRQFAYCDITEISDSRKDVILFSGKHKIRIDELAVGKREFLSLAKKEYRKLHNGTAIPKRSVSHKALFNGHLDNAGEFIFIYALFYFIIGGFLVWLFFVGIPIRNDNLIHETIAFTSYEIDKEDLILYTNNNSNCYMIMDYQNYVENIETFLKKCDGSSLFKTGTLKYEEAKKLYYSIEYLQESQGTIYLSLHNANVRQNKEMLPVYAIFGGFLLIWTFYVVISIKIARNPQKYSKKLIRLFFKDGYIH